MAARRWPEEARGGRGGLGPAAGGALVPVDGGDGGGGVGGGRGRIFHRGQLGVRALVLGRMGIWPKIAKYANSELKFG